MVTPTSPRVIQIDPRLPNTRSHSITIPSPNAISPARTLAPPHQGQQHRGSMTGRSYRDDPEGARQRQMQQDMESAMSMSRARSGSMAGPEQSPGLQRPSTMHFPSTSPIEETHFPMLSDAEEAEMDRARSSGFRNTHGDDHSDDGHGGGHYGDDGHSGEDGDGDEGLIIQGRGSGGSSGYDSHSRLMGGREEGGSRSFGRRGGEGFENGRQQAPQGFARNTFDFSAMEDFAGKSNSGVGGGSGVGGDGVGAAWMAGSDEGVRRRSGAESEENVSTGNGGGLQPVVPGSYGTTMDRTTTMSAYGDGEDHEEDDGSHRDHGDHFKRRRQRKLSASNSAVRRPGKLAIFEGFGAQSTQIPTVDDAQGSLASAGVLKAPRQPKNLKQQANGNGEGFQPFTDAPPGQGHDRPYRFSFYSNALPVIIHSRSLGELPADGQTFEDLFKGKNNGRTNAEAAGADGVGTEYGSVGTGTGFGGMAMRGGGSDTPKTVDHEGGVNGGKMSLLARAAGAASGKGDGGGDKGADEDPEAFTWWLDVLSPTDEEMRMLSKVFGIHPLTTEDILLEETREKIELFRNYYLVCFRSFDQDPYSQTYLEPLNMYIIVFREGTLSFHFRGTPHPQNVRRRIKHLKDYISVTSDWISYALIDDITDAFGPLIQSIEYEVDSIDELVLILKEAEQSDMLRRIGTCRKKVMGLLRLMGNKADVVKGLAKRCNEQWLVAPKSDIGLYLSDIQDHLITMTQNLNHYEKILSRSHSNYLAQISIEMTDANNQINDVLSKLTALGTVLIPMNLVTGLWGMNVHVPGQDIESGYAWFGGILGCLAAFAVLGAWATYKCFVR